MGRASGLRRCSASLPRTAVPTVGGTWSLRQEGQNGAALKDFWVNGDLMNQELSLLSSCPKSSDLRKEDTITASALFYFSAGKPDTMGRRRKNKGPTQSIILPRSQEISHLSPCQGSFHNSEQQFFFRKPSSFLTKRLCMFWSISVLSILFF